MLEELEARRAFECRLTSDRALESLDEAAAWARDRGLLTGPPSGSLPSLHVACHEPPYAPDKPGFGQWPRTKWWWGGALAEQADLRWLKVHRGRSLLVADPVAALVDPLARIELARAEDGAAGEDARRLVEHLAAVGPSLVAELKEELGLDTKALRAARSRLERVAAVVARSVRLAAADGGHTHSSELVRWDQLALPSAPGGIAELLAAGVRAAVLVPEKEAKRWYSWPVEADTVDALVEDGVIGRVSDFLHALR